MIPVQPAYQTSDQVNTVLRPNRSAAEGDHPEPQSDKGAEHEAAEPGDFYAL
jgi:hypothetical protein